MTLQSTCAIVLKVAEHGEADKLVTCYSRELGRMTGLAKGAKRSSRRFVNKLEEFSLLQLFYRPPRDRRAWRSSARPNCSAHTCPCAPCTHGMWPLPTWATDPALHPRQRSGPTDLQPAVGPGRARPGRGRGQDRCPLSPAAPRRLKLPPRVAPVRSLRPARRSRPELPAAPGHRRSLLVRRNLPTLPGRNGQPAVGADHEFLAQAQRAGQERVAGCRCRPAPRTKPWRPCTALHPAPAAAGYPLLEIPARPPCRAATSGAGHPAGVARKSA